ncbi:hypothetical protein [Vibrio breoganii]|uniref:Uncharacterized protein n=1 Tax=Vibrio breoganii TaxID=553239 RepID=A0ABX1UEC1_9VIBR|nr:hypothetical protein [Vibrio breoganii]NMO75233.1 hypothetical protein [Vibrio breoganii]NMR71749.1 hypothetical protein [Vibrio breoganii]PML82819.1 hypothetical protein BCT67_17950 [Vibrio breoganii]
MHSSNNVCLYFEKSKVQCFELIQNRLLNEAALINFSKLRGFFVSGVVKGDPSKYIKRGWLNSDNLDTSSTELFHPFRFYPLHIGGELCKLNIAPTSTLDRDSFNEFLPKISELLPSLETISKRVETANLVATLGILLEPIYWPRITSKTSYPAVTTFDEYEDKLANYREQVLSLVRKLDPTEWCKHHENLRFQAAEMDDNSDLYILLRLSPWIKMERTTGQIGGALWIRLIAEVLRRAFRDVHNVDWPEEDQAFGQWYPGARERTFGTEFPTDNTVIAKPHLAFEFGLHTGSTIRWYLEGETEYYAALHSLPRAASGGVELINLKGAIGKEKASTPLRLADSLFKDKELRRFSFISFDGDVSANVRAIKRQIDNGNVVGYINHNDPDFEFANFTLCELIEVAANLDEEQGVDTQTIRNSSWANVGSGKAFEERYRSLSNIGQGGLKGERWGAALAHYALNNPFIHGSERKRPFFETLNYALLSRRVKYEYQRDNFRINSSTFQVETLDSQPS